MNIKKYLNLGGIEVSEKLTGEHIKFIKENWFLMSNKDIAKTIGVATNYVSMKAREIGLPDKRIQKQPIKLTDIDLEEIKSYKASTQADLEREGRSKNMQLLHIKEAIKENKHLKIKVNGEVGRSRTRFLDGIVLQKSSDYITLKLENYTECFRFSDFYTGKIEIIKDGKFDKKVS